jgi:hypothetical protein
LISVEEQGVPKIKKGALAAGKTPMFVNMVLKPIWDAYEAICVDRNREKVCMCFSLL